MKTYWLQEKEYWTPVSRLETPEFPLPKLPKIEQPLPKIIPQEQIQEVGRAAVYSPITFKDVARRSIASSPVKTSSRGELFLSNSIVCYIQIFQNYAQILLAPFVQLETQRIFLVL